MDQWSWLPMFQCNTRLACNTTILSLQAVRERSARKIKQRHGLLASVPILYHQTDPGGEHSGNRCSAPARLFCASLLQCFRKQKHLYDGEKQQWKIKAENANGVCAGRRLLLIFTRQDRRVNHFWGWALFKILFFTIALKKMKQEVETYRNKEKRQIVPQRRWC